MGGRKGGRRPKGGDDGQGGSRRGKKKGGHGGGGKDQGPTLKEAQRLEQKAEKNGSRGKYSEQALAGFRQAIEIYLALYDGGAGPAAEECLVGLAGCYMGSAECKAGYLSTLSHITQEGPVKAEARFLAQQCSECYRKLLQRTDLEDREEVLVNLGNALSVWAENAETGPEVIELLGKALSAYDESLSIRSDDADTHLNRGDLLQKMAEELADSGDHVQSRRAFAEANSAYEACCSVTDSTKGDDLVGLLESWGANLLGMAQSEGCGPEERRELLGKALGHLTEATAMEVTATRAMNTIGDCHVAMAETVGLGPQQRLGHLEQAVAAGYQRALAVDRSNLDASVGVAEVHAMSGKAFREAGDVAAASTHFAAAAAGYERIFADQELWREFGGCADRSDFLYNAACACALAGRPSEARQALEMCLSFGLVTQEEIVKEEDLRCCL